MLGAAPADECCIDSAPGTGELHARTDSLCISRVRMDSPFRKSSLMFHEKTKPVKEDESRSCLTAPGPTTFTGARGTARRGHTLQLLPGSTEAEIAGCGGVEGFVSTDL